MTVRYVRDMRRGLIALGLMALVCAAAATTLSAQGTSAKAPPATPPGTPPPGLPDLSKLPKTVKVPTTFEGIFAERDARARAALGYLRCMQGTVSALRSGALGAVPRDLAIACIQQGDEWRGVFGELGEVGIKVRLQYAFRGNAGVITRDAVDTARVNGTARALLRGLSVPLPGAGKYEFTPVPLPQGQFLELWFLPVPGDLSRPVVGGDSLIQMSADGSRELGHGRSTPPIRQMTLAAGTPRWTITSTEERIPTVSELMAAYHAVGTIPEVRIRTRQYESTLTRNAKGWTHRQP